MDPWDIVSDPFESPKVYRHKVPLIRNPADGKGVYLFVVDKPNVPPIALHDLGDNVPAPELRILIENEPIELGSVGRIPRPDGDGYLNLASIANEWTLHKHSMKNLDKIPKGLVAVPYRLKSPDDQQTGTTSAPKGPNYSLFVTPSALPTLRGVISGASLLALRHAIMLAAYISK